MINGFYFSLGLYKEGWKLNVGKLKNQGNKKGNGLKYIYERIKQINQGNPISFVNTFKYALQMQTKITDRYKQNVIKIYVEYKRKSALNASKYSIFIIKCKKRRKIRLYKKEIDENLIKSLIFCSIWLIKA